MYRTVKTHDLILKGVPDSLRAEVWLIFSGAINQVTLNNDKMIKLHLQEDPSVSTLK